MKSLLLGLLAVAALTTSASAQDRTLGAQQLVLDNGAGGRLYIQYNGVGHDTIFFGNGGTGSFLPAGANSQTLRHDGSSFIPDSNLLNDGSRVRVGGGVSYAIRTISSDDSLTEVDHIVFVNTTEGSVGVRLPLPTLGRQVTIRNSSLFCECSEFYVYPNSDETIDGDSSVAFYAWMPGATFVSDGTDWHIVNLLSLPFF